mgnify:CR=1 FL=1
MLSGAGLLAFVTALKGAGLVGARFIIGGARYGQVFPVDAGYPCVGDADVANDGRGSNVLTWRFTVPRGTHWGESPADGAELLDGTGVTLYSTDLRPPFRTSPNHPCLLFININLRKA